MEIQFNALKPGTKVLLVDDLLATGGQWSVELLVQCFPTHSILPVQVLWVRHISYVCNSVMKSSKLWWLLNWLTFEDVINWAMSILWYLYYSTPMRILKRLLLNTPIDCINRKMHEPFLLLALWVQLQICFQDRFTQERFFFNTHWDHPSSLVMSFAAVIGRNERNEEKFRRLPWMRFSYDQCPLLLLDGMLWLTGDRFCLVVLLPVLLNWVNRPWMERESSLNCTVWRHERDSIAESLSSFGNPKEICHVDDDHFSDKKQGTLHEVLLTFRPVRSSSSSNPVFVF